MTRARLPFHLPLSLACLALVGLLATAFPVSAQQTAKVLSSCGTASYTAGTANYVTMDTTGAACGSGGGGGGGGTSSTFGAAFPATGTAIGFKDSTGTNMVAGNLDASGFLKVDVAAGSAGNGAASNTGSAVPTQASYNGLNIGGTLRGQTGVNPSGSVYAGQEDTTSINGVTTLTGAGASGTGSQRVTVAQDTTTVAGSAPGTAGTASANVLTVQGVASMTPVQVSQATAANLNATVVGTGTFAVQDSPTATATGGATPASILSANSTNATVVKNGAGTLYHISIQNTSTTALGYLIFFNTATTPTCTASPYYGPVAIPYVGSTGNNGSGVIEDFAVGLNFSTGISYCITTAPAGTGSVAANAITGGLGYK